MNRGVYDTLSLDQKIAVATALQSIEGCQQVLWQAYEATGDESLLKQHQKVRDEYVILAQSLGGEAKAVFTKADWDRQYRETSRRLEAEPEQEPEWPNEVAIQFRLAELRAERARELR